MAILRGVCADITDSRGDEQSAAAAQLAAVSARG